MKRRLMELLRCPLTQGPLELVVLSTAEEPIEVDVDRPACQRSCALHGRAIADGPPEGGWRCGGCYGEEIVEGLLVSRDADNVYPILAGVPRVLARALDAYPDFFHRHREVIAKHLSERKVRELAERLPSPTDARSPESFGKQWKEYEFEDRTWFKDLDLRRGEFLQSMALEAKDLDGTLLLDAGCGHGALTSVLATYGLEAIGMDFTQAVERAQGARARFAGKRAPFVHYLQGDLLQPPLAPEVFDNVHCSGVIHHTPLPERAFSNLKRTTKPGGRLYIQVYRKREAWVGIPNAILRAITTRLPIQLVWKLCWLMAPVHAFLVRVVARLRGERSMIVSTTRREQTVSLFDNYSPKYQFRYHERELRAMFEAEGMQSIEDTTLANEARHMVACVGVKPGVASGTRAPERSGHPTASR